MPHDRTIEDRAWESYWRENEGRGCVPDSPGVAKVLGGCWTDFARSLPPKCMVLDLGTGAGAVLDQLSAVRPDLQLFGIDSAASIRPRPGMEIITSATMESLAFDDSHFAAACSQFGFEYSDTARSSAELARVLAPHSPVRLIIHDRSGPIVKQSKGRLEALRWAVEQNDFFGTAERLADARSFGRLPTPPSFAQAIATARQTFPRQPVAADVLSALHAILIAGERGAQDSRAAIRGLRDRATNEMITLNALMRAARDRAGVKALAAVLEAAGIATAEPAALVEPQCGLAFAWLVDGMRIARE